VILWTETVPIGEDDNAFFVRLGARTAESRKSQYITQVEMAKTLGVSRQTGAEAAAAGAHPAPPKCQAALRNGNDRYRACQAGSLKSAAQKGNNSG
jgi:hypothetical protein